MFREIRRKKQALTNADCLDILRRGSSGVLAVSGDDGYPYAVPLSYAVCDGKIFFHCAKAGHKLDAIARNQKASFCVIDQDRVVAEKYTTYYKSVIVFGKIRVLKDDSEKHAAIAALAARYAPDAGEAEREKVIQQEWTTLCLLELSVEHISGKAELELIKKEAQLSRRLS